MQKIFEIRETFQKECSAILSKETLDEIDLQAMAKIFSKDNTHPNFVLAYLKCVLKVNNDKFLEQIEKYKFFLSKEIINNEFGKYYFKKISALDLFNDMIDKISLFSPSMTYDKKMIFYKEITYIDTEYDVIRGISYNYTENRELSLYILVHNMKYGIIENVNKIKNYSNNNNNKLITKTLKILNDAKIYKKVEDFYKNKLSDKPEETEIEIYKQIKKKYKEYDAEEIIIQLKDQVNLMLKVDSKEFITYFKNYSNFIIKILDNFNKRFKDIEKLDDNDFELFMNFAFFLTHYDFKFQINFYSNKWNNTFYQPMEYMKKIIEKTSVDNSCQFKINNNDLDLEIYDNRNKLLIIMELKNINEYCIDCVINDLLESEVGIIKDRKKPNNDKNYTLNKTIIDKYPFEKHLKFD
jgi:hypothetical protein